MIDVSARVREKVRVLVGKFDGKQKKAEKLNEVVCLVSDICRVQL